LNANRSPGWQPNCRQIASQVLSDGGQNKLIQGTSRATQSEPTELRDEVQVSEHVAGNCAAFVFRAIARGKPKPRKKRLGTLGCPALDPVTSFLFLRYRLQSFKVGAEVPNQAWDDVRHLIADSFSG
jgi:hypothetical protein